MSFYPVNFTAQVQKVHAMFTGGCRLGAACAIEAHWHSNCNTTGVRAGRLPLL